MLKFQNLVKEVKLIFRNVPSLIVAIFFISVICMNILANKSIELNLSWLALDAGILFSWMAFFSMDIIVKRFGPRAANIVSIGAIIINLLIALMFFIASLIPGVWSASFVEGSETIINNAFDETFKGTWYIILGSTIAFIASSITNNTLCYLLHKAFKNKTSFKVYAIASYVSTAIGQFVDNIVFALLVSKFFFGWTLLQCVTCALTGMVVELLLEVIASPIGFRFVKKMEKENVGIEYLEFIKDKTKE